MILFVFECLKQGFPCSNFLVKPLIFDVFRVVNSWKLLCMSVELTLQGALFHFLVLFSFLIQETVINNYRIKKKEWFQWKFQKNFMRKVLVFSFCSRTYNLIDFKHFVIIVRRQKVPLNQAFLKAFSIFPGAVLQREFFSESECFFLECWKRRSENCRKALECSRTAGYRYTKFWGMITIDEIFRLL